MAIRATLAHLAGGLILQARRVIQPKISAGPPVLLRDMISRSAPVAQDRQVAVMTRTGGREHRPPVCATVCRVRGSSKSRLIETKSVGDSACPSPSLRIRYPTPPFRFQSAVRFRV